MAKIKHYCEKNIYAYCLIIFNSSGEQLVTLGAKKSSVSLPELGLKEVFPNGSWLEQKQIQNALEARKYLLETERIEKWCVIFSDFMSFTIFLHEKAMLIKIQYVGTAKQLFIQLLLHGTSLVKIIEKMRPGK